LKSDGINYISCVFSRVSLVYKKFVYIPSQMKTEHTHKLELRNNLETHDDYLKK